MSPILGIWASQNYSRYSLPTSYDSIATVTVGAGGATDVDFTSIPGTYTHLQIRYIARATAGIDALDTNWIRFNGDSGSNYDFHYLTGNGSSAGAGAGTSQTYAVGGLWPYDSTTANSYGAGVIDILDYANTNKNKTIRVLSGAELNTSTSQIWFNSGLWRNTSAITSIKIKAVSSNTFKQYTQFALYGIKGA